MYYHPSMFNEGVSKSRSFSDEALIQALLHSIERQQRVQMDALEIVARLGKLSSESQRHLIDLLACAGARHRQLSRNASGPAAELLGTGVKPGRCVGRTQMTS